MTMRGKAKDSPSFIEPEASSFDSLPLDILSMILAGTTPCDIGRLALVSRSFAEAAKSDLVWKKWMPLDYESLAENLNLDLIRHQSMKELYCLLRSDILAAEDFDGLEGYSCDLKTGEIFLTYTVFTLACINCNVSDMVCFYPERKAKDFSDYGDLIL